MNTIVNALACMLMVFMLGACSRTTVITKPDGSEWTVKHSSNALVQYKKDGAEIKIDDRGRASFMEEVFKLWTLRELNKED